ncbi:MAG: hypothetical protein LAO78_06525 [Acidobacteriia bacterium]|nr:hypothetical protein [Terriglobia bacterium]
MRFGRLLFFLVIAISSSALSQEARVVSVSPDTAGLNGTINVVVENLDAFLKPDSGKAPAVVPFLDGYPLKGSRLEYVDRKTGMLRFSLIRNPSDANSRESWNHVLGGIGPSVRHYALSVGKDGDAPLPSRDPSNPLTFNLIVFPRLWSVIAFVVLVVLLVTFIALAVKTDMLKDPPVPDHARSYSLGRCQMAWWFFIVIASFTCIWLVTGDLVVPPSSLILLGISSATALSAVIVNPKPDKENASGFLTSLLEDGNGISFHRFQMFGWTLIIGIIFISKVVSELAQPTLDATLLTLMGISSGTYIGFKFPEKTSEAL